MHFFLALNISLFLLCFHISTSLRGQTVEIGADGKVMNAESYLAASTKKEQEGDYREASRFMNGAATWHWERKEYEKAIAYFEKSIDLNEKINNQQGIVGIKNNLGMIYADLQQYDKALSYFEVVLQERRKEKAPISIIASLINLSVITNNLKKYDKSIKYLEEAASLSIQINDAEQLRAAYGSLAETYEKLGNTDKMLYYFDLYKTFHEKSQKERIKKVVESAEEARLKAALLETESRLKSLQLKEKTNIIEEQENVLKQFNKENQELLRNATRSKLLQEILERDKDVAELKTKALANQLAKEEVEQQLQVYVFGLILCIILLGVAVLIFRNRQIHNYNILLKAKQEEIRQQAEELLATSHQIDEQNRQLTASNAVKDKILSIIAHDVRSPLGMITGFLDLLNSGDLTEDEIALLSQQLYLATDNTLQMVENLLLWGRSQMKGIVTRVEKVDLHQLVEKKINLLATAAELKNIQLIDTIPPNIWVNVDKMQIDIVLHNLLANAIKFTPQGGVVSINGYKKGTWHQISVVDTGVGMTPEQIDSLFNLATHSTTKGTQGEKGTGLGLLLCKEFVENHGGKLYIESTKNKGPAFSFMVPLCK
jgi:two-component system sensor histidine kinase/response regulator